MNPRATWVLSGFVCAGIVAATAGCGTAGTPMKRPAAGTSRQHRTTSPKGGAGRPAPARPPRGSVGLPLSRPLHVVGFAVNARHASFEAVASVPHLVSEVAPFWYSVQSDGTVTAMKSAQTEVWAHRHSVPLMPLFNNAGSKAAVLLSAASRAKAVANIASIVKANNYDGASVDFQGLPAGAAVRSGLSQFVSALATRLHAQGKRLTVDVIPTRQATAAHGAYDETALAKSADQIVLMAYDRHATGSPPGPVAPMPWVREAVRHALALGVKPAQLLLGVANYGYDWPAGSTNAATVGYAQIAAMGVRPIWDAVSGEYHFTYVKHGTRHIVWYEGTRSLAEKVALAKAKALSGIAIWRLGYDNAQYWTALGRLTGPNVPKGGTVVGRPMPAGTGTGTPTGRPAGRQR
jgi:spore germination protein